MTNVAFWGLGSHAQRNLIPAAIDCKDVTLNGAWSRNKEKLSEVCSSRGIKSYTSSDEMLSDDTLDTIILCTPTGLHPEQGLKILKSGKNLWSEKSLYLNKEQRRQFSEVTESRGLAASEMFMFLYHPQFKLLRSLIESGNLGMIFSISARFCIPHLDPTNIRYDPEIGGGALFDAGCYPVAACHSLLGNDYSEISSKIIFDQNYDVDIRGNAMITYPSGTSAFLEWGFGMTYSNEIRLRCENANVLLNRSFSKPSDLATSVEKIDSSGKRTSLKIDPANHFTIMMDEKCNQTGTEWILRQSSIMEDILENSGER